MRTRALVALSAAAAAATPTATALAAEPAGPATDVAPAALAPDFAGDATLRQQMRRHLRERLVARYVRTARRHDHKPSGKARSWSNRRLRAEVHGLRHPPKPKPKPRSGAGGPTGHLAAIAQCESGGDPRAIGGGGTYRGMYQFSYATWQAVGGSGDPAAASVAEQTKRAQILYAQAGPSQWPVCGQ
jgi:hypothetical protein